MSRTINKNPRRDMSRLRRFAQNNLGVIMGDKLGGSKIFRSEDLEILDQYYEGTIYDDLHDWDEALESEDYVPVRKRKPRVQYNLPKVLVNKVAAKLIGSSMFPTFIVEDDEDDTAFFRTVLKASKFRRALIEPIKHMLRAGACFVRYSLVSGSVLMEHFSSKYCYPQFDALGELDSIDVKYVFDDQNDLDVQQRPKKKWFKISLSKEVDISYDNPDYKEGSQPTFQETGRVVHGLGWVQGEWLVTHKDKFNYDGYSLYGDILDFCDDINYSLSQSSQATSYNQEPQLGINNMDEDEIDGLIRSSQKAWNLGREGEAKYIESNLKGVEQAEKTRDHMRNLALDVVRVCIHDPEKMAGSAQSGTALNILNAPLVELVDELRAVIEPNLVNLLIKIAMTCLHFNAQGEESSIITPPNYIPTSLDLTVQWPPIFPPTLQDVQLMAQAATALSQGKIISRESLTRWMAPVISSVDNIEEELKKIDAEPDLNPFGSSFGGP